MKFKHIKLGNLITFTLISVAYPLIKFIIGKGDLLIFVDSLTIISFLYIILGIVNSMFLHGDFDISGFMLYRKKHPNTSYNAYKANRDNERADSFNYPLFLGCLYLVICIIITKVYF